MKRLGALLVTILFCFTLSSQLATVSEAKGVKKGIKISTKVKAKKAGVKKNKKKAAKAAPKTKKKRKDIVPPTPPLPKEELEY